MKKSSNLEPLDGQAEGLMQMKKQSLSSFRIGEKYIIDDMVHPFYSANCIKVEQDCITMKTLDGRIFRITNFSQVQGYRALFINKTNKNNTQGYQFGNSWFNLHESWLIEFLNKDRSFYVLYEIETNEMCKYPDYDERSTMRAQFVVSGDWQFGFRFC